MKFYRPDPRTLLLPSVAWLALWWCIGCAEITAVVKESLTSEDSSEAAPPAAEESSTLPAANPSDATDAAKDEIDPATVSWDEPAGNVGAWPITATLTGPVIDAEGLHVQSITGTDDWPRRNDGGSKPTIGNWWLIRRCADGKWHAATVDWYGPKKTRVVDKHWAPGKDGMHGCSGTDPFPAAGDQVGVMVSGCARAGADCGTERSNIAGALWPARAARED